MVRRGVRGMKTSSATGVPEELARDILGARPGSSPEHYKRVLKRAVTQGYLMRKNNKYYFIPSKSMRLPSLVVMRRRGRRKSRRAGRGRSRRRSTGVCLEPVMNRSPVRRRRPVVRCRTAGRAGGPQRRRVQTAEPSSSQQKVEKKPSDSK